MFFVEYISTCRFTPSHPPKTMQFKSRMWVWKGNASLRLLLPQPREKRKSRRPRSSPDVRTPVPAPVPPLVSRWWLQWYALGKGQRTKLCGARNGEAELGNPKAFLLFVEGGGMYSTQAVKQRTPFLFSATGLSQKTKDRWGEGMERGALTFRHPAWSVGAFLSS